MKTKKKDQHLENVKLLDEDLSALQMKFQDDHNNQLLGRHLMLLSRLIMDVLANIGKLTRMHDSYISLFAACKKVYSNMQNEEMIAACADQIRSEQKKQIDEDADKSENNNDA